MVPAAAMDNPKAAGPVQTAVLAGGCFWGMQGVFEHVKGVHQVVAGYSGGDAATAHYELVGSETTGHAESVKITFDPKQVTFGELLRVYFSVAHDPTQLNRQGPDRERATAPRFSRLTRFSRRSPTPISRSSTARTPSRRRS